MPSIFMPVANRVSFRFRYYSLLKEIKFVKAINACADYVTHCLRFLHDVAVARCVKESDSR